MVLDKWIAALFLVVSIAYGYTSFTYQLLPFERNMSFLPNTLPNALAIIAAVLSLIIILSPSQSVGDEESSGDNINVARLVKDYEIGQASYLIIAMIVYALALRPTGFLVSTTLFLMATGWILGERKLHIMTPIAIFSAILIWYLVQETLGLYLRPLPWFLM
ncbi:MAG: tripartite tricarboxylate transporter TctB family protein [Rhodospirillales bacterium]|jgi:putative tricarboxylic transport membrane protein|nr:tripartite tricarboxylate transporter TctB family protein [Rhodospirillales bacterium]